MHLVLLFWLVLVLKWRCKSRINLPAQPVSYINGHLVTQWHRKG